MCLNLIVISSDNFPMVVGRYHESGWSNTCSLLYFFQCVSLPSEQAPLLLIKGQAVRRGDILHPLLCQVGELVLADWSLLEQRIY